VVEDLKVELNRKAEELLKDLRVSKEVPSDFACIKDPKTRAVICVGKILVKNNVVKDIRYIEVNGSPLYTKGKTDELLKLKKEAGLT